MRSSSTLKFQRGLNNLREGQPVLRRFADPVSMLEYLHHGTATSAEKNGVLAALVAAAKAEPEGTSCAQTLLLLALWPGLDAVRSRLRARWRLPPHQLAADVAVQACTAIANIDLSRVNWIASTILRNVERDIGRSLVRDNKHAGQLNADVDIDMLPGAFAEHSKTEDELASDLHALIGRDADLVLAVALEGQTQVEAGAAMGLAAEAARKRFQRATRRLQDTLQ